MGMLAAFAGGAAQGVQSHWADVRDKVATEAKQAFEERMLQKRADIALDSAEKTARLQVDLQKENAPWEDERALTQAEKELQLQQKYATPEAPKIIKQSLPGNMVQDGYFNSNGQFEPMGSPYSRFKPAAGSTGSNGSSKGGMKTNLEPLSMDGDMDYPNVWVDTKTGIVVDPQGQLLKPQVDMTTLQAEIDQEIKERRGGVMGFYEKDDKKAFNGLSEEQFRKMELQRRTAEAPTLADELGFGTGNVVRSEQELAARYQQMNIPVPGAQPGGGYMTQADSQAGQQTKVSYSPDMFEEGEQEAPQQAGENSVLAPETKPADTARPEQSAQPEQKEPPKLSDDERAALEEFGIKVETPELNKPMRNPYAGSNVLGTIGDFATENAPATTKLLSRLSEIPGNINEVSTNAAFDVVDAVVQKHRDMVASGERMKAKDKERMKQKLTEAFFSGEQSVDAAKMVLENDSATARQKVAARAYLKLKGQM